MQRTENVALISVYHAPICFSMFIYNRGIEHRFGIMGGGVLHKIFSSRVQHSKQNWTQLDLRFKINEKGANWIDNQGEN